MKKIYLGLFIILFTSNIKAQSFSEITETPFEGVAYSSIAFADVDNDNDQDVLITGEINSDQPHTILYTNDGNGNFEEVTGTPFDGVFKSSIAFSDIDNDKDQDVLITGENSSGQRISKLYTNDGIGIYVEVLGTSFDGIYYSSISFADVDNDNDQDVLITGANSSDEYISKLYTNDGNGNFEEVLGTPFDGSWRGSIAFADIDNDNDQDILITGQNNLDQSIAKLYKNNGNGNFEEVLGTPFDGVRYSSIAFADVDNDNDQDVLITGFNNTDLSISKLYTNDGNGNFEEVLGTPFVGVRRSSVAFADVDNDNDQDVLITGHNSPPLQISNLYSNNGNGGFVEVEGTPFESVTSGSIAFADIDNDNDQDVLITGFGDFLIHISKLYRKLTIVGINEISLFSKVSIYPNPNTRLINIDLGSLTVVSLKVINVSGQLIYYKEHINAPIYQFELDAAPGIYILELSAEGEKQQFKLVKQ